MKFGGFKINKREARSLGIRKEIFILKPVKSENVSLLPTESPYRKAIERQYASLIHLPFWDTIRELFHKLPQLEKGLFSVDGPSFQVGTAEDLNEEGHTILRALIEQLIPWRKGPFTVCGHHIDSEWRAEMKWDRMAPLYSLFRGKRIADIGCNNGYYMFRLLSTDPEEVVGLDPNGRFFYQFNLIQHFLKSPRLSLEPLGVQHFPLVPHPFDVVLCMGVLYHRRDPLGMFAQLYEGMVPGGVLVLETLAIEKEGDFCLCPQDRYAKMRNVWFIPSFSTLRMWLRHSGFTEVEYISSEYTTVDEQRATRFSPSQSLADFVHPTDKSKTIEGYPGPYRLMVIAKKASHKQRKK